MPSAPANTVRCLNIAFRNRDSTSVAALLADTFIWDFRPKQGEQAPDPTDKAITLEMLGRLCHSPRVVGFAWTLLFDRRPKRRSEGDYLPEGEHGVWEVEDRGGDAAGDSTASTGIHRVD